VSELITRLRQRAEFCARLAASGEFEAESHAADDALLREAADHIERFESVMADPIAVHINMLRGSIAKPSITNIVHLYGAATLRAHLKQGEADGD